MCQVTEPRREKMRRGEKGPADVQPIKHLTTSNHDMHNAQNMHDTHNTYNIHAMLLDSNTPFTKTKPWWLGLWISAQPPPLRPGMGDSHIMVQYCLEMHVTTKSQTYSKVASNQFDTLVKLALFGCLVWATAI